MPHISSPEQHLDQILVLKTQIVEIQEKLREIETQAYNFAYQADYIQELESLAHPYSSQGSAICNSIN